MSWLATGISVVATIASTGAMMYGQKQQAKAVSQAADYNNKLAENEARNLELQTAEAVKRERINNRRKLADLRNRISATGADAGSGSLLNIFGETAGRLELGIADAARASAMQALSMRNQGAMGLWEADQTAAATKIAMVGTAASGVSSAFGTYSRARAVQ